MSDKTNEFRSYNDFSEKAIYNGLGQASVSNNWSGWSDDFSGNASSTPITAENLNAMLNMLIYIRNVIGKTTDFDTKINSGTDNVSQPDTDIDKYDESTPPERLDKSIATYLKDAFGAIIGTGDDPNNTNIIRTLAGLKQYLESLDVSDSSQAGKWISKLTQTDGQVAVEYSQPDASDITYTKESQGTNLESGKTVDDALDKLDETIDELDAKINSIELTDNSVKLSAPYTFTKDFGYYTLGNNSYKEFGEEGQTLRSFLEGAFSQVDNDVLTSAPTYSVTISGNTSAEIGTIVTPTATVTATPGSYKYGTSAQKQTGITYSDSSLNPSSFSTLTYKDSSQTLTVTATADRSEATNKPINNLAQQIGIPTEIASKKTVTATASKTFTGYREGCFYGSVSNISNVSAISSTVIRGLDKKLGKAYAAGTYKHTVAVGDTAIIIACPAGKTGVTKVYNATVNAEMTSSFKQAVVKVSGANNYSLIDYNIWYYIPSSGAYTQSAALEITLG